MNASISAFVIARDTNINIKRSFIDTTLCFVKHLKDNSTNLFSKSNCNQNINTEVLYIKSNVYNITLSSPHSNRSTLSYEYYK